MRRSLNKKVIVVFVLCLSVHSQAQRMLIPTETAAALQHHCSICAYYYAVNDYLPAFISTPHPAAIYFHYAHISFGAGNLGEADRYIHLTISAITHTPYQPVAVYAMYLQAKINQCKNVSKAAISHYLQFLASPDQDAVLRADTYAALTGIYWGKQEWKKAAYYLNTWQRRYASSADPSTKKNLYDMIAHGPYPSKRIAHPALLMQTGIRFFRQRRDTGRLVTLYYHMAAWYERRSRTARAVTYLKKGLALATSARNMEQQQAACLRLAGIAEANNRFRTALQYRKAYDNLRDSIRIKAELPEKKSWCTLLPEGIRHG